MYLLVFVFHIVILNAHNHINCQGLLPCHPGQLHQNFDSQRKAEVRVYNIFKLLKNSNFDIRISDFGALALPCHRFNSSCPFLFYRLFLTELLNWTIKCISPVLWKNPLQKSQMNFPPYFSLVPEKI